MTLAQDMRTRVRSLAYFLLLTLLSITGAQGEPATTEVRIGLQTQQPQVQLQGSVPVRITGEGVQQIDVPAEQVITFTAANGGITATDSNGLTLFTTQQKVQIRPAATTNDTDATASVLIRLLGPTRHYDKKADRPYRGSFELLPQPAGITVVNVVPIEPYLWGVVSSEMSPSYPIEALKAQAVAARTYALKNIGHYAKQGFDMDDTARCQVYGGYFSEDPRTTRAVNDTAGIVLTFKGELIDAVYSSTCGGITESAEEAWGKPVPYLVSVPDYPDKSVLPAQPKTEEEWAAFFKSAKALNCLQPKYARTEAFRWVRLLTRKELEAGLPESLRVGTVMNIVPVKRGSSGRITALRLEGSDRSVTVESELAIRNALGGNSAMRSSAFTVETYRDDAGMPVVFALWGGGWGHGLGLCQVGAVGLADQGWTYDRILTHYYRGVTLRKN